MGAAPISVFAKATIRPVFAEGQALTSEKIACARGLNRCDDK